MAFMNWLLMIQLLIMLISIMVSVAFFSLFERKMLAVIQLRKGPNKVLLNGLLQPISDALKLVTKFNSSPLTSINWVYFMMPMLFFFTSLITWMSIPMMKGSIYFMQSSILFISFCLGINVYFIIFLGWFSNSKYSLIGSIRSVVQTISYEIVLSFLMLVLMVMCMSADLLSLMDFQDETWLAMSLFMIMPLFIISMLAELNRTPFDLTEGESELVSGYCIEYGGILYTFIFLSENSSIMFMCMFLSLTMGFNFMILMTLICLMVWIRGTLPRIRFDMIMDLCWVKILPPLMAFMTIMFMVL